MQLRKLKDNLPVLIGKGAKRPTIGIFLDAQAYLAPTHVTGVYFVPNYLGHVGVPETKS